MPFDSGETGRPRYPARRTASIAATAPACSFRCVFPDVGLTARVEAGGEFVLTRRGRPAVRLVAEQRRLTAERKLAVIAKHRGLLKGKPGLEGITAANIADDLYDERGLPA